MSTLDSQDDPSAQAAHPAESADLPRANCFRVNEPSVIYQAFDQEVVAVNLNTGSYHTLPGIAGEVFVMLGSTGGSAPELAAELATRYEIAAGVIEKDLETFFHDLQEQAMIVALDRPSIVRERAAERSEAQRTPYSAPTLESFSDLEGLVLIDPIHEVGAAGWPNLASETIEEADSVDSVLPLLRCRLAGPNVIFERFESETVAMDLSTGAYHSLSGVAEEVFLLMPNVPTTWEIREVLAKSYVVEADVLDHTLRDYLNQLVEVGLIGMEKTEGDVPLRDLGLGSTESGRKFVRPTLETFDQPTFDQPLSEQFSHEQIISPADESAAAEHPKAFEPYAKRHYSIRTGDLLFSSAGGELVISDRDGGKYFKLNEAASDIFRLLEKKPDVNGLIAALTRKYVVREQDLRVALMILLWNLRKLELVTMVAGEASPENSGVGVAPAEARIPFTGFDVAVHHDLSDLLRPFNTYTSMVRPKGISQARQLLSLMDDYFEESVRASEAVEANYSIAGSSVKIRCAGGSHSALLMKAFEHLRTGPARSDLTISAWNYGSAEAGPFLEPQLARLYENWSAVCGPRGEWLEFQGAGVTAIYHPGPDVLSLLDRESGRAFYLLRNAGPLPFWELSSPFRHILHPWFSSRGLQYTHAGAVGGARGGVLFAGKGGSGKSTTTLLCSAAGMLYAGDDYCLTSADDAHVYSLYNTAKLKGPEDLERVPEMRGRSFNEDSFEHGGIGKGTFNLMELWPERMATGLPLRAILLPTVTGRVESRLEPCSAADALLALAPSTVAQLPFSGHADCDRLAALVDKLPCYRLHLGTDRGQIPVLLRELVG
jgi:hypothetical protein